MGKNGRRSRKVSQKETSAQSSEPVVMVPQPHGGALRVGNPGNAGGGRTPDAIRRTLRDVLDTDGIPLIRKVIRGEEGKPCSECGALSVDQRLKAADMAGRYGLPAKEEPEDWLKRPEVQAFLAAVERSIRRHVPDATADAIIADVKREARQ